MSNNGFFDLSTIFDIQKNHVVDLSNSYPHTDNASNIVSHVNELQNKLNSLSAQYDNANTASGAVLTEQRDMIDIVNTEHQRLLDKQAIIDEAQAEQERKALLNTTYRKKYAQYSKMTIVFCITLFGIILLTLASRYFTIFPQSLYSFLTACLIAIGIIYILVLYADLSVRDNINYDEIVIPPPKLDASGNLIGAGNATPSMWDALNKCKGSECCSPGTKWDADLRLCVSELGVKSQTPAQAPAAQTPAAQAPAAQTPAAQAPAAQTPASTPVTTPTPVPPGLTAKINKVSEGGVITKDQSAVLNPTVESKLNAYISKIEKIDAFGVAPSTLCSEEWEIIKKSINDPTNNYLDIYINQSMAIFLNSIYDLVNSGELTMAEASNQRMIAASDTVRDIIKKKLQPKMDAFKIEINSLNNLPSGAKGTEFRCKLPADVLTGLNKTASGFTTMHAAANYGEYYGKSILSGNINNNSKNYWMGSASNVKPNVDQRFNDFVKI